MEIHQPSRTAWAAAVHRAVHQVLEQGRIFSDPLAARILGGDLAALARDAESKPHSKRMRIFIAARTRFAEDALAAAVERGVRQLVVLGAGLDTFAYRNPFAGRLTVFEVDHPATQAWKRQRLAEAGIAVPASLIFAPLDFERSNLAEGLAAAGFDRNAPAFFTWLGVVPYLTLEAIWFTLSFIAAIPDGAHVVFDYANPPASLEPEARVFHDNRAQRVAEIGEAWLSYFETGELHQKLMAHGFTEIEDLGPAGIAARYFPARFRSLPENGGHVVHASSPLTIT